MAPRRPAGIGNVVWSLNRVSFAFLNAAGPSATFRVDGLLAHAAPLRVRALPCFTQEETGRLLEGIERLDTLREEDYAMVMLAVSTGCAAATSSRCGWRRSIGTATRSGWSSWTSRLLVLLLPALAGNASRG